MNVRRVTSLVALLSFVLMLLTSTILYIVPAGRVAYWADWQLMGLSKEEWGSLHINLGILFLLSIILHIYYNWKAITTYLKDRAGRLRIVTANFSLALLLVAVCGLGTYFKIPPFINIIQFSEAIKERAAVKYGEPPYGHAELSSLREFSRRLGLELEPAMTALRAAGFEIVGEEQTLLAIAQANRVPPQQVYLVIKQTEGDHGQRVSPEAGPEVPATPPSGFGRRSLSDICAEYGLPLDTVLAALAARGVAAKETQTMRTIMEEGGISSEELLAILRQVQRQTAD
ncbi:DUF4405 domain-containing protein [Desulfurivibrio sp. C05AmB]|jgi:hypothetical protein|uniref:DUF4405 domain-containing protein n=1 Tax=Desulfurivibrio sp. C05AmB TaxID=3374371 RepID=UPI00376EB9C5